jgi:hypothetical protein
MEDTVEQLQGNPTHDSKLMAFYPNLVIEEGVALTDALYT